MKLIQYTSSFTLFTILFALVGAIVILPSNIAVKGADFTTPSYSCTIPLTRTNWDSQITFGLSDCELTKFDQALGTLTQVNISMSGEIESEVGMENRDTAPQTITADVSAEIQFRRPDNSELTVILPTVSYSEDFPVFDGSNDFDGDSGTTIGGLQANDSQVLSLTGASDLLLFTNSAAGLSESVALRAIATGISNFNASANYSGAVDTFAAVSAQVSYQYTAHNLGLTLSLPDTYFTGEETNLSVNVINNESTPTVGTTTILIALPEDTTYVSVSNPNWNGVQSGNELTLTTSSPVPVDGQSFDISIIFGPESPQQPEIVGVISGSQLDYNPNNNTGITGTSLLAPQQESTSGQVLGVNEVNQPAPLIRSGSGLDKSLIMILYIILGGMVVLLTQTLIEEPEKIEVE